MLGVHRAEALGLALDQVHDELAAHDERLLVGEGDGLAVLQGGQCRRQSGGTDEGVQDDVGLRIRGESLGGVGPDEELDALAAN